MGRFEPSLEFINSSPEGAPTNASLHLETGRTEMYDFPGIPIGERDIRRYIAEKKALLKKLPDLIRGNLQGENFSSIKSAADLIPFVPEPEQEGLRALLPDLIRRGLQDEDSTNHGPAGQMIHQASPGEQVRLRALLPEIIKNDLQERDHIAEGAARIIQEAPAAEQFELVSIALESEDRYIQEMAAQSIPNLTDDEQIILIPSLSKLIRKSLEGRNWFAIESAAELISYIPKRADQERVSLQSMLPDLIRDGLDSEDPLVNIPAARTILHVSPSERASLIRGNLAGNLYRSPGDENWFSIEATANMISHVPTNEQLALSAMLPELIRRGLKSDRRFCIDQASFVIEHAPKTERLELWREYREAIGSTIEDLQGLALETPLYAGSPGGFFRDSFPKGGSRTTLLDTIPGGSASLKNKVIIRHITIPAYASWARAFEAYDFWKTKGFEYVPIEPILGVRPDTKDSLHVAVFARVLGPNVDTWKRHTGLFQEHIEEQVENIREALREFGVTHGHDHDSNFCLMFNKTEDGKADLQSPPRVYMIDFDASTS